jgi:hypothetical protein
MVAALRKRCGRNGKKRRSYRKHVSAHKRSMTSLRVNVLETVFVPLITELLSLAKGPLKLSASNWSRILFFPQICEAPSTSQVWLDHSWNKFARHQSGRCEHQFWGTAGGRSLCANGRRRRLAQTEKQTPHKQSSLAMAIALEGWTAIW